MMDDQAEWIAALESGELDRPSETEMQAGIARERYRIRRNYPDSPRYGLELDPREYRADLAKVTASRKATT
jgi:dimethylaniline monooxygenase (N-oxide forming)